MDPEVADPRLDLRGEDPLARSTEPMVGEDVSSSLDRDPNDINAHLKVSFEDVIAEPESSHSFDKVWIGSHAAFELLRFVWYRLLSTLLAVPLAFLLGLMFGGLSFIHIWMVTPLLQGSLTLLPPLKVVWRTVTDMLVAPLSQSVGRSFSSIRVSTTE